MTRKYTKAEAIGIVVRCAQTYKQELDGKNLLFICTDKHKKTIPIELSFYGNNYLHLTGLKAPKSENGDIAVELFANDFYQKCLDHKLSPTDFDFAEDGTTHMKLDVLSLLMYSHFLFPIWHSVFLPVTLPQWDRGGWGTEWSPHHIPYSRVTQKCLQQLVFSSVC